MVRDEPPDGMVSGPNVLSCARPTVHPVKRSPSRPDSATVHPVQEAPRSIPSRQRLAPPSEASQARPVTHKQSPASRGRMSSGSIRTPPSTLPSAILVPRIVGGARFTHRLRREGLSLEPRQPPDSISSPGPGCAEPESERDGTGRGRVRQGWGRPA